MPINTRFILALQLSDADLFRKIFGEAIAQLVREDIIYGFGRLCESLLQRYHHYYSEVISPRFGRWYLNIRSQSFHNGCSHGGTESGIESSWRS